ncbi:MAG: carbonic anhydrase, partial [Cyclobacteriaceae bacterium]|nr:carbonic anhydrase [Cyclobacteriaceae bacterium]
QESGDRSSANNAYVQNVADKNVELAMQNLMKDSPVLAEMINSGAVGLVGGMYSVETGEVKFK